MDGVDWMNINNVIDIGIIISTSVLLFDVFCAGYFAYIYLNEKNKEKQKISHVDDINEFR